MHMHSLLLNYNAHTTTTHTQTRRTEWMQSEFRKQMSMNWHRLRRKRLAADLPSMKINVHAFSSMHTIAIVMHLSCWFNFTFSIFRSSASTSPHTHTSSLSSSWLRTRNSSASNCLRCHCYCRCRCHRPPHRPFNANNFNFVECGARTHEYEVWLCLMFPFIH